MSIPKNEKDKKALDKILGTARYVDDLRMEGMLYLKVLRSPVPHAELLKVDPSPALKIPQVAGVLTAGDVPQNRIGIPIKDRPLLAEGKLRLLGEAIALVGAETPEAAEEAKRSIRIEYRELEAVLDPERAMRPDSPLVHEKSNILAHPRIQKGNIEEGFAASDVIIENTFRTPWVLHAYMEKESGLAFIDESGRITLFASTQYAHENQREIAHALGLAPDRVRVIQKMTGGGFGGKIDSYFQCLVALGAYRFRRPVKLTYSRPESFLASFKRHPLRIRYKTGARKDGKILAVEAEIICDTGAYASLGPGVANRAAIHATGPYEIPNVKIESYCVYTNNPICGAMRGFGVPQVALAHESQMDLLAEKLGLSPFEVRRVNYLKKNSVTATGQVLKASVGIGETLREIERYLAARDREEKKEGGRYLKGRGLASIFHGIGMTGLPNPSEARVEIRPDSSIWVLTGAADLGQGSDTALTQIAAQELGVPYEAFHTLSGDSAETPDSGVTAADRQTYASGNSVRLAAADARRKLLETAAALLEANAADLAIKEDRVFVKGSPGRYITLGQAASAKRGEGGPKCIAGEGRFEPPTTKLDPENGQGIPYATYAFGTQMAEVEVDIATGEVRVKRIVAAHDLGKKINPQNIEGQIEGGVVMGVGYALTENYIPGETLSFGNYQIPTAEDLPQIITLLVEDPEPTGPFGAKGVGEPSINPTAAAIANAVSQAIGVRITELHITAERVLRAIREKSKCKNQNSN